MGASAPGSGAPCGVLDAPGPRPWVKANGHRAAQDLWESYLAGPESGPDPAGWRTELSRPLR